MTTRTIALGEYKNISALLADIDSNLETHSDHLVYRGASNHTHKLVPSLFREQECVCDGPNPVCQRSCVSESKLFESFRRYHPKIASQYEDDWELMSFMRHNGYPVRMLDFSHNILVALYFACSDEFDKDGALYAIVKNQSTVLQRPSNRPFVDLEKWRQTSFKAIDYQDIAKSLGYSDHNECRITYTSDPARKYHAPPDSDMSELVYGKFELTKGISELSSHLMDGPAHLLLLKYMARARPDEAQDHLNDLYLPTSTRDRPVDLKLSELAEPHFIEPPVSNARVRAQSGLFLVAGGDSKEPYGTSAIHPLLPFDDHVDGIKLTIRKEWKPIINRELSRFGVAKHTLFPEIDHQVQHIMNLSGYGKGPSW